MISGRNGSATKSVHLHLAEGGLGFHSSCSTAVAHTTDAVALEFRVRPCNTRLQINQRTRTRYDLPTDDATSVNASETGPANGGQGPAAFALPAEASHDVSSTSAATLS
jgi:hypothetical protein